MQCLSTQSPYIDNVGKYIPVRIRDAMIYQYGMLNVLIINHNVWNMHTRAQANTIVYTQIGPTLAYTLDTCFILLRIPIVGGGGSFWRLSSLILSFFLSRHFRTLC